MKLKIIYENLDEVSKLIIRVKNPIIKESKFYANGKGRTDRPHYPSDTKHSHREIGGGKEVCWDISGKRRHENKFPKNSEEIPRSVKQEVAGELGIEVEMLEAFDNKWFVLYDEKTEKPSSLIVELDKKIYE